MSEAVSRFAALLQLSDKFLARAEREDLEECARVLAVQCAHYQSKFGKLPITDTLEVLSSETMNDEQATVEQAEKCLAENARLARRLQRLLLRTGLLEGRTLKRMLRGVVPRNITDWTKAAARPLAIDERLDTILRMAGGFALQVIGAAELKLMRDKGAVTIAQDSESSVVHGMPGEAIVLGGVTHVLPADKIAAALVTLVNHRNGISRS